MTSAKATDGFEFQCDVCGEVIDPPRPGLGSAPRDFMESWEEAKAKGWRAVKVRDGWEHKCPKCA
jgi:predicted RNA-binding Zn-ribbon protein involved in translation (DUF1610 family)